MHRDRTLNIFRKIPTLETPSLIMRKIVPEDYLDMYEYSRQDLVTQYLLWKSHPSSEYTHKYLKYVQGQYRSGDFYDWALELKKTGKMIGTCGFTKFDFQNNCAEIGYVINPDHWGRGYASEAVSAVLNFGFSKLSLNRIEARYIVGNEASRKVMEKNGMTFEGIHKRLLFVKGRYVDVGVCAKVNNSFQLKLG